MRVGNMGMEAVGCGNFLKSAATAVLLAGFLAAPSLGQQAGQKTFASPEEASKALYAAAKSNDEKAMLDLLGPDGKEIVSSGDEAEDAQSRAEFVKRYEEMNRLVKEPDGSVSLYIGAHNWPCPIPLVNKGSLWYFDTASGKQEILFRRIGRNEISAIHVCRELAAAQKEYYSEQHNEFARRIHSEDGKHGAQLAHSWRKPCLMRRPRAAASSQSLSAAIIFTSSRARGRMPRVAQNFILSTAK
jgi:Protein of unknown function (DUF2950)